jgi:hypothetical protein
VQRLATLLNEIMSVYSKLDRMVELSGRGSLVVLSWDLRKGTEGKNHKITVRTSEILEGIKTGYKSNKLLLQ